MRIKIQPLDLPDTNIEFSATKMTEFNHESLIEALEEFIEMLKSPVVKDDRVF